MYNSWEELKTQCMGCTKCDLCKERHNVVFGQGVTDAEVMFIGEGPGEQKIYKESPLLEDRENFWIRCWKI